MRKRITISIQEEVLKALDKKIDGVKIRNRSHAIEQTVSNSLGIGTIKDVILMAGGEDAVSSLDAIKDSLLRLKKIGIDEVIIALGFLGDKIKKGIGDGKQFAIKVTYLEESEGTGGAISKLRNALKKSFIVINLDHKLDINYSMLIDFHKGSSGYSTIATDDVKSFKGVYILEPEVIKFIPKGFSLLEEDLFPKLHKEGKLTIYPVFQ